MFGVVINKYGNESVLNYQTDLKTPQLKPNQVMVEVHASSVNPLDLMKREGYGAIIFEKQRQNKFPWALGSDFSGVVKDIGSQVTKFKVGD